MVLFIASFFVKYFSAKYAEKTRKEIGPRNTRKSAKKNLEPKNHS